MSLVEQILAIFAVLLAAYVAFKVVKWVVKKMIWATLFSILVFLAAAFFVYQKFFA
ncbi:MAG: hypothetical protein P9L99_06180 [Candidatus Lernaella stagnicola]|nr:hypothetical protein [Candidatus Lernaella stagnicola]